MTPQHKKSLKGTPKNANAPRKAQRNQDNIIAAGECDDNSSRILLDGVSRMVISTPRNVIKSGFVQDKSQSTSAVEVSFESCDFSIESQVLPHPHFGIHETPVRNSDSVTIRNKISEVTSNIFACTPPRKNLRRKRSQSIHEISEMSDCCPATPTTTTVLRRLSPPFLKTENGSPLGMNITKVRAPINRSLKRRAIQTQSEFESNIFLDCDDIEKKVWNPCLKLSAHTSRSVSDTFSKSGYPFDINDSLGIAHVSPRERLLVPRLQFSPSCKIIKSNPFTNNYMHSRAEMAHSVSDEELDSSCEYTPEPRVIRINRTID